MVLLLLLLSPLPSKGNENFVKPYSFDAESSILISYVVADGDGDICFNHAAHQVFGGLVLVSLLVCVSVSFVHMYLHRITDLLIFVLSL